MKCKLNLRLMDLRDRLEAVGTWVTFVYLYLVSFFIVFSSFHGRFTIVPEDFTSTLLVFRLFDVLYIYSHSLSLSPSPSLSLSPINLFTHHLVSPSFFFLYLYFVSVNRLCALYIHPPPSLSTPHQFTLFNNTSLFHFLLLILLPSFFYAIDRRPEC